MNVVAQPARTVTIRLTAVGAAVGAAAAMMLAGGTSIASNQSATMCMTGVGTSGHPLGGLVPCKKKAPR